MCTKASGGGEAAQPPGVPCAHDALRRAVLCIWQCAMHPSVLPFGPSAGRPTITVGRLAHPRSADDVDSPGVDGGLSFPFFLFLFSFFLFPFFPFPFFLFLFSFFPFFLFPFSFSLFLFSFFLFPSHGQTWLGFELGCWSGLRLRLRVAVGLGLGARACASSPRYL